MNVTYADRLNHTILRVEECLVQNKSSVKTYKSKLWAESTANTLSQKLCAYWGVENAPVEVLQLANGRFFCAVDLNNIMQNQRTNGYGGAHIDGHFTISCSHDVQNTIEAA